MLLSILAILFMTQPAAHETDSEIVDMGSPLAGSDFLLIATAARHPAMHRANLACYRIYASHRGARRVIDFVEADWGVREVHTSEGTDIIYPPHNPRCRSISFEMDRRGRVVRVIRTRLDHP
jgi:hypothetical protein